MSRCKCKNPGPKKWRDCIQTKYCAACYCHCHHNPGCPCGECGFERGRNAGLDEAATEARRQMGAMGWNAFASMLETLKTKVK